MNEHTTQTADLTPAQTSGFQNLSIREKYDSVPALNYEEALKYLASDDIIGISLAQFYENIAENADEIERLWREGDIENYTIRVHALKSSARLVGLHELSGHAARLEALGDILREPAT